MQIQLQKTAVKALSRINEPNNGRIKKSLVKLSKEPPEGDIKKLANRDDYRLRVGDYRILFRLKESVILITDILIRGQAYKGGNQ